LYSERIKRTIQLLVQLVYSKRSHLLFIPPFRVILLVGIALSALSAFGQGRYSNMRYKTLPLAPELMLTDSFDVVKESIVIKCALTSDTIAPHLYQLIDGGRVKLDTTALGRTCAVLNLSYRVLDFSFTKPMYRFDSLFVQRHNDGAIPIEYDFGQNDSKNLAIWESPGLNTAGAYTRGFALGNNQNLNFNSDLNLQLSGRIGGDIEINAAIADQSVPIQPDGSTRNIQEFDRIYIQLKRKQTALLAGDFELSQPNGRYFTKYYKKLQGASVSTEYALPKALSFGRKDSGRDTLSVRVGAAISRGKFNRMIIQGQEGNQGPYRLQGAEGERFIILLAGTEKVFIDGQVATRGMDDDYIIYYNLGEISFTAKRLITKDIRIIVEFEYVVQNYLRTTLSSETEWRRKQNRMYLSTYSEQDNPNTSGIQDISAQSRLILAAAGDSLVNAYSSGIDTLIDGFDPDRVLYQWLDTLVCGVPRQVLAFSTDRNLAVLAVRFSELPFGQGNYIRKQTSANGLVFAWTAPDPVTCQPTGNFEPLIRLTAPEQKQVFAVGAELNPTKSTRIAVETAVSNRDVNRYSRIDDQDDRGVGLALSGRQAFQLKSNTLTRPHQLTLRADFEYAQDRFRAVNPYRAAEFVRDWNVEQTSTQLNEKILKTGLAYQLGQTVLSYDLGRFDRSSNYLGNKHLARLVSQYKGLNCDIQWNQLNTETTTGTSQFERPRLEIAQMFSLKPKKNLLSSDTLQDKKRPILQIGTYLEREKNARFSQNDPMLLANSFWYDLMRVFIRMPEQRNGLWWDLSRSRRLDFSPVNTDFRAALQADEVSFKGAFTPPKSKTNQRLNWNITHRKLIVRDAQLTNLTGQTTWLGRVDYAFSAFKNALSLNTGYEVGSGQNPKLEFTYIQVNPGEGNYTWIDRNQDSILQVDEMEISVFQDQASYIRLAITTNQFIQTNHMGFNQNLRFEPRLIWAKKKGALKTMSKFSLQSHWQLNRKVKDGATDISPWNPFQVQVSDTSLVNVTASGRQTLFFQRAHPRFETSISQANLRNRFVATTGYESRGQDEWLLRSRYNPKPQFTIDLLASTRALRSDAEVFNTRDYAITEYAGGPELTWLFRQSFRAGLNYRIVSSANQIGEKEQIERHSFSLNTTYQPSTKKQADGSTSMATSVRAQLTLTTIAFQGDTNTPIAFVMMEGLQNGKNILWNVSIDRQLSKFMQLGVTYEGRRPGFGKVVHVARAQVRALF
jgi:hypothetical protein